MLSSLRNRLAAAGIGLALVLSAGTTMAAVTPAASKSPTAQAAPLNTPAKHKRHHQASRKAGLKKLHAQNHSSKGLARAPAAAAPATR